MIRCFIALSLPESVTDSLIDIQDRVRNARWVEVENMHLTLAFLGERTPSELTDLDTELDRLRFEPFELEISGVGAFGGAKPHTLYAGLAASEPLARLQSKIMRVIQGEGLAVERRKFTPHVTLARCGGGVIPAQAINWTLHHARLAAEPFTVHGFSLYRSDLGPGAPVYTELVSYPFLR